MTLGRCPLSIFCSRGTPPREVNPESIIREKTLFPGTAHTRERFMLEHRLYESNFWFAVQGTVRCVVSGVGFRVSGFGFRVSGSRFRVSGFEFRVSVFIFVSFFFFRSSPFVLGVNRARISESKLISALKRPLSAPMIIAFT